MTLRFFLKTAFICIAACGAYASAEDTLIDKIVAVVNNDVVLSSELDRELELLEKQAKESGQRLPETSVLEQRVLERLIQNKVLMQRATTLGISVDENTLNRAITSVARNNNMSLGDFRQALRLEGIDYQGFREGIREELTISRLRAREVDNKLVISPRDIDNFLKRSKDSEQSQSSYRLQHILVGVPDGASSEQLAAAQQKINEIASAIKGGSDFGTLAATHSDGARALDGGDIGWRKPDELPELFSSAISPLKAGDVTEILRSPNGFHLLKVIDLRSDNATVASETRARHILIKDKPESDNDKNRITLQGIRDRIVAGESFEELAKAFSEDSNSAVKGGELPWFKPGEMVPQFEQVVANLPIGQLSEPFRSDFGWHIAEPLERRQYNPSTENRRKEAEEILRRTRSDEEYDAWLRRLRSEAYVELRDAE